MYLLNVSFEFPFSQDIGNLPDTYDMSRVVEVADTTSYQSTSYNVLENQC